MGTQSSRRNLCFFPYPPPSLLRLPCTRNLPSIKAAASEQSRPLACGRCGLRLPEVDAGAAGSPRRGPGSSEGRRRWQGPRSLSSGGPPGPSPSGGRAPGLRGRTGHAEKHRPSSRQLGRGGWPRTRARQIPPGVRAGVPLRQPSRAELAREGSPGPLPRSVTPILFSTCSPLLGLRCQIP